MNKTIKKIAAVVVLAAVMIVSAAGTVSAASPFTYKTAKKGGAYVTRFYSAGKYVGKVKTSKHLKVRLIKSADITEKRLASRAGKYIVVEVIDGKCIANGGDGRTVGGDYISYKRVKGHKRGKRYTTYCVYGNNNSPDDIVIRADVKR